ncbi:hypothetical protein BGZ46_003087 [Entomortierella lignicola]|nr:hypothetical protein BGZ46_003087 [Entomortierella lignicola]
MSSLPSNICIGPKIRATRILIDKPITPQNITISNPRPIRRFSSFKGTTDLTINTSTITPSRTIGLEVASIEDSKDTTKSPPMSRDGIISPSGRRMSTQTSDDRSQLRKMTFSIRMQYRRQKENSSNMLILTLYHLLQSTSLFIDRLLSSSDGLREQSTTTTKSQETKSLFDFHPVILHQSQRIVHNGRVGDIQPDDDSDETLCLEISASTTSMEISAPIQILVKVETQPTVQDAFGNTDMIRKGETVLMEGLGLAREMAHTAGWSCLEEDDSRMVEWVRDQMNIKWSSERQPSTFLPVSTALEGLQTVTRLRTLSTSSLRIKTPNLSPYPSRTHSFNGKRRESPGSGDRRDSTLKRLQDVTETLQQHEQEKQRIEEEDNNSSASKVTIAAATVESGEPQRPGLKTSFSGFSSLNNSRIQSLTLAEETEDHLGMSLSISPSNGSTGVKGQTLSPPPPPPPKEQLDTFNDCIEPLDFLGMNADKQVSPKPKALSRFSIKSYQLERSNHGLGDEWAIGGNFSNTLGASTTTKSDFLTTPPLIADQSLSGTVSPLTPSPEGVPVTDFLQGLSPPKLYVPVNRFNYNGGSSRMGSGVGVGLGVGKGGEELFNSPNQDGNINDNGSRRLSSIGSFSNLGSATKNGIAPLQSEKQYEATQDFLGESFGTSPIPAFKSKYDGTYNKQGLSFLPTEIEKDLLTPTNLGVTATTTTKTVQFADTEQFDDSMTSSAESQSLSDNSFNSSSSSSLSSLENSKFKAHTRRSWGQGIGGSDILGIQGLS